MKVLRSLLRASPRYFQVYRTCREIVLSHVAWNQITPDAVPIALDALEQRENKKSRRDRTEPFSSQRGRHKEPPEIPLQIWNKLLRFHDIVDTFISGFTNSRLFALENPVHLQSQTALPCESPNVHLSLTQLEYSRLARGFYNMELYSTLFYDLATGPWPAFFRASLKRAKSFLQSLRDWEYEELLCVQIYMIEILVDFLNKFENDFMEAYQKDRPEIIWQSLLDTALNSSSRQSVYLYDEDWMQGEWIESSLTRGLEALSAIISTDTLPAKYNALKHDFSPSLKMNIALYRVPDGDVLGRMKSPQIGYCENIDQPNGAWFWAIRFCGSPMFLVEPEIYYGLVRDGCDMDYLRRWGYVIWDNARLIRLAILTKSPSNVLATIGTDWVVKRTPITLKERTMKQEEIWTQNSHTNGEPATLSERRPVFDWGDLWLNDSQN